MTLPTGTITFLFTDIEGSTKLWEQHPDAMRIALARHDEIMHRSFTTHNGCVFKTVGDAFHVAFTTASAAVAAARDAQLALAGEHWDDNGPINVRIGIHTGAAEERDNDYFGPTVNRVARLQAVGHGQQVLISHATYELVIGELPDGCTLLDLGTHRFKDLASPEHVWQLLHQSLPRDFPPLRSLGYLPTNIPQQLTSFIGRTEEMAEIKKALLKTRLLTLTGSGGTGKTRLALQAAAEIIEQYSEGVWLVELAPISDPSLVPQTVAEALSIRESSGEPISKTLVSALQDNQMLLLLDNCEHVLDAAAHMVNSILKSCPRVAILASSREALGIGGEVAHSVPSLPIPEVKQGQSPEDLAQFDAVRLFLDRAAAVRPDFALTSQNAASLASVCRRLDGIPLAIELAAARLRAMPLEQVEARLDDSFRLLTGGSRTALPRQQTLRALIDWSYDLLNEPEKSLLMGLSVFAGGWTLDDAESTCSGDPIEEFEVVNLLTALVEKSLVVYNEHDGGARYYLLETVRQYSRDRLVESGGTEGVRERHLKCFLDLAEQADAKLTGPEQGMWLQRLEDELENMRAALTWSSQGSESRVRLCGALQRFWWTRGYLSEGREWSAIVLEKAAELPQTKYLSKALNGAGAIVSMMGDDVTGRAYLEAGLAINRDLGNRRGVAISLNNLALVVRNLGDARSELEYLDECLIIGRELNDSSVVSTALYNLGINFTDRGECDAARSHYEESLNVRREMGDRSGIANSLNALGNLAYQQENIVAAREYHEEALSIAREIGEQRGVAFALNGLGHAACRSGEHGAAREFFLESLALYRNVGDKRGIEQLLDAFGTLSAALQDFERASVLWGAAERLRKEINAPHLPHMLERIKRELTEARDAIGEVQLSAALARGRAMTIEQAMDFAGETPMH